MSKITELEKQLSELNERVVRLEVIHRLQALPLFWLDCYIVDYEGPEELNPSDLAGGVANCPICKKEIFDGESGYVVGTQRREEMLDGNEKTRLLLFHQNCFIEHCTKEGTM